MCHCVQLNDNLYDLKLQLSESQTSFYCHKSEVWALNNHIISIFVLATAMVKSFG